jgi:mono/diheme cytochrome c family protein
MRNNLFGLLSLIVLMVTLAACGSVATPAPDADTLATADAEIEEELAIEPAEDEIEEIVEEPTEEEPTPTFTAEPPTVTPTEIPPTATVAAPTAAPTEEAAAAAGSDDQIVQLVSLIGDPATGEQIFQQTYETNLGPWACSQCHSVAPDGVAGIGPAFWGLANRTDERNPDVAPGRYIYNSIVNSNEYIVEGYNEGIMPQNWGEILSDDELYHLVAYIMTLQD